MTNYSQMADCSWRHWYDDTIPRLSLISALASKRTICARSIWISARIHDRFCTVPHAWIHSHRERRLNHLRHGSNYAPSSRNELIHPLIGRYTKGLCAGPDAPFCQPCSCGRHGIQPNAYCRRTTHPNCYYYLQINHTIITHDTNITSQFLIRFSTTTVADNMQSNSQSEKHQ